MTNTGIVLVVPHLVIFIIIPVCLTCTKTCLLLGIETENLGRLVFIWFLKIFLWN